MFRPDGAILKYIRTHNHLFILLLLPHAARLTGTNTRNTGTGQGNTNNTPLTRTSNKSNTIRVQEETLREKDVHIGIRQQEIGKRGTPKKEEEEKDMRIKITIIFIAKPGLAEDLYTYIVKVRIFNIVYQVHLTKAKYIHKTHCLPLVREDVTHDYNRKGSVA
jgi:hypothetical protein